MHYISGYAVGWFPNHSIRPSAATSADSVAAYPSLFFWVALVHTIQKEDELQKRIWHESVFIAFMATLFLTFA